MSLPLEEDIINDKELDVEEYNNLISKIGLLRRFYRFLINNNNEIPSTTIKQILNLSDKDLQNSNLIDIYRDLRNIKKLEFKIECQTNLSNHGSWLIGQGLNQLPSLECLRIQIPSRDFNLKLNCDYVQRGISSLIHLKEYYLEIGENNLKDNFQYMGYPFKSVCDLQVLHLTIKSNGITSEGFYGIFKTQITCSNFKLEDIYLKIYRQYKMSDSGFMILCEYLIKCKHLKSLALIIQHNDLTNKSGFQIGNALKSLTNLNKLILDFSDSEVYCTNEGISESFKFLTNLTELTLDFGDGKVGTDGLSTLLMRIPDLQKLNKLKFSVSEQNICNLGASKLNQAFHLQSEIVDLNLVIGQGNLLEDEGGSQIKEGFKNLQKLHTLRLVIYENNGLTDIGWLDIFEGIVHLSSLITLELYIHDAYVSLDAMNYFGQNLFKLTQLKKFDCIMGQCNRYKNCNWQLWNFTHTLDQLKNLNELSLFISKEIVNQQGLIQLSQAFMNLQRLENLSLTIAENSMQHGGAIIIGQGLKYLINLKYMHLDICRYNQVYPEGAEAIGYSFLSMNHLEKLLLSIGDENYLGQSGAEKLAFGLRNQVNLTNLSLAIYKNDISSEGEMHLSRSLKEMLNLEYLSIYIGDNYYFGSYPLHLGEGLSCLSELKQFSFNYHKSNNYYPSSYSSMIKALQKLPNLTDLSIISPDFEKEVLEIDKYFLYMDLRELKNLQKIQIYSHQVMDFTLICLIQDLQKLNQNSIQLINMATIKFEREFISIDNSNTSLSTKDNIKKLEIVTNENLFTNRQWSYNGIDFALQKFTSLSQLQIQINYNNNFTHLDIKQIFDGIKNNKNLFQLDLVFKQSVKEHGVEEIINGLAHLQQLKSLKIQIFDSQLFSERRFKLYQVLKSIHNLLNLQLSITKYCQIFYLPFIKQLKELILRHQQRLVLKSYD